MKELKRLYIFTGKGGVGKTTCAFSFAQSLNQSNKNVLYAHIANSSISKSLNNDVEIDIPALEVLNLELKEATAKYVALKLNSKIIGSLVVKAPFFKSLVSMIPGFNYLIYLGTMIQRLKEDPSLHIVFDSPSSGHALTMLKASNNFAEIFKSGVIYDDTKTIKDFLFQKGLIKLNILSIPTEMAINEAIELQAQIEEVSDTIETQISFNNVLDSQLLAGDQSIPSFLVNKIHNEQEVIEQHNYQQIPHSTCTNNEELVKEIIPFMEKLI